MERNHATKKTRQLRCQWCIRMDHVHTSYTSFECSVCRVPICCKSNRNTTRDCFDVHWKATPIEIAILTSTSEKRFRAS